MENFVFALVEGTESASFGEACAVAGFTIAVVFVVLLLICLLLMLSSKIIALIENAAKSKDDAKKDNATAEAKPVVAAEAAPEEEFSSGTLKLKGCDEKTAAMIMAIVSDNTGIPLSELIFKSITLVEKN